MKALIVDDCAVSCELLRICISDLAEADIARDGKEATDLVRRAIQQGENYNLICLDLNMPVLDGHETMQAIRRMESEAAASKALIFMITASDCPNDMITAITLGECDDYMVKPVMRKAFLKLLQKHGLCS